MLNERFGVMGRLAAVGAEQLLPWAEPKQLIGSKSVIAYVA